MKIQYRSAINHQQKTDCLLVTLKAAKNIARQVVDLDKSLGGVINRLQSAKQFEAKQGQITTIPAPKGLSAKSLILLGVGEGKKIETEALRDMLNKAAKTIKSSKLNDIVCDLSALSAKNDAATLSRHLVEALGDTFYEYQKQPKAAGEKKSPKPIKLCIQSSDRKQMTASKKGGEIGLAVCNGKTLSLIHI